MTMRSSGRDKAAGFSLAEVMVALAVFSFLAVALGGGLSFGIRVWEKTRSVNATYEETELALEAIRTWFSLVHPFRDFTSDRRVAHPFVGTDRGLTFSASLRRDGLDDGLYRISLSRESATNVLTAHWIPDRAGVVDPKDNQSAVARALIQGVEGLTFRYFEPSKSGATGRWIDRWADREDLPVAIEMKLRFEDGIKRVVVARTRINKEANCRFDPVSRGCR